MPGRGRGQERRSRRAGYRSHVSGRGGGPARGWGTARSPTVAAGRGGPLREGLGGDSLDSGPKEPYGLYAHEGARTVFRLMLGAVPVFARGQWV